MSNRSTFARANQRAQQAAQQSMRNHATQYVATNERNLKFHEVKIGYKSGWWSNKPDEVAITATIENYRMNGWQYVDRKEDWRNYTVLRFR